MCDPGTIIAGASLAIGTGSAVVQHKAQAKAAKANEANAVQSMVESWKDISLQEVQQQDATALTIMQSDRAARKADALARVSAGEAGVAGASVDAFLGDLSAEASAFKMTQERNLNMTTAQLQREKISGRSVAQNRINAVPAPNLFATGLTIASQGLDFATKIVSRKPSKGS